MKTLKYRDMVLFLILRWIAVLASILIYLLGRPENLNISRLFLVIGMVIILNFLLSLVLVIRRELQYKTGFIYVVIDIIQATAAVIITGGYDSLFFVMYLLPLSESILIFRWEFSAAIAVLIDSIQMAATSFHLASQGKTISTYLLVNRFVRLMIVGFILIILSVYLRKTEEEKEREERITKNLKKLNAVFNEIGYASLDLEKIFSIIISEKTIDREVFCSSILTQAESEAPFVVEQSTCKNISSGTIVSELNIQRGKQIEILDQSNPDFVRGIFSRENNKIIHVLLYKDENSNRSIHLVLQQLNEEKIGEDMLFFLNALALKTQLAIGNALTYEKKRQELETEEAFRTMQSTFFTAASHELKTPLTILSTLLSSLSLTINAPTDMQAEILEMLENNLKRLNDLTADIINTARLDAESISLHLKDLNIKDIFTDCMDGFTMLFEEKKLKVDVFGKDVVVKADAKWIFEIISNILSNAYKYSKPDSRVSVYMEQSAGEGILRICNEGDIIKEEEKEKIFDKFYTSPGRTNKNGFGLGLYIAKRIIALHQGRIWVMTKTDLNCICFSIPLASEKSGGEKEYV